MDTTQKTYRMLKTLPGSRDGLKVETFTKGETYELGAELAEQFYHEAAIEEVGGHPANSRQKKINGPAETKEGEAGVDLSTQNIEELVALARDTYGLDVDSTMGEDDVRSLIELAQEEAADGEADTSKMTKKQLVAYAKDLGLELDEASKKDDMLEAIKAHTAA